MFRSVNRGGRVLPDALTDRSVALIVKAYAERAGLDPAVYAGHSLRAGFLTSAAENGANVFKMMEVSPGTRAWTPFAATSAGPICSRITPGQHFCETYFRKTDNRKA